MEWTDGMKPQVYLPLYRNKGAVKLVPTDDLSGLSRSERKQIIRLRTREAIRMEVKLSGRQTRNWEKASQMAGKILPREDFASSDF